MWSSERGDALISWLIKLPCEQKRLDLLSQMVSGQKMDLELHKYWTLTGTGM